MSDAYQQSIQEGLRLARAAVDQREPELAVLYTVGELTTICEALVSLEEQLETYKVWLKCASDERDGFKEQLETYRSTLERIAEGSEYTWGNIARLALESNPAKRPT